MLDRLSGVTMVQLDRRVFLWLIFAQAGHSLEEYVYRLFDVLAPARYVSGVLGFDRETGFVIFNTGLVLFGLWCWFARVRPARGRWRVLAWFWALLETANGVAHFVLAGAAGGYFPGLWTAPLLIAFGLGLMEALGSPSASVDSRDRAGRRGSRPSASCRGRSRLP